MTTRHRNQRGQVAAVILAGIVGLVIIAAIVLGGWWAGWWFAGQNANREAHVIRQGYSNQQTIREEITSKLAEVQTITVQIAQSPEAAPQLRAQRLAVVNIVCGDANQITGDPINADQAAWVAANCSLGSINPTSPLNIGGNQ